jgi:hypothetical protein
MVTRECRTKCEPARAASVAQPDGERLTAERGRAADQCPGPHSPADAMFPQLNRDAPALTADGGPADPKGGGLPVPVGDVVEALGLMSGFRLRWARGVTSPACSSCRATGRPALRVNRAAQIVDGRRWTRGQWNLIQRERPRSTIGRGAMRAALRFTPGPGSVGIGWRADERSVVPVSLGCGAPDHHGRSA